MKFKKIFSKFILGTAASQEKDLLHQWKQESEENLSGLQNLLDMQQNLPLLENYQEVNIIHAWTKMESKIQNQPISESTKGLWIKAAAILTFVLGALFLFKELSENLNSEKTIVSNGQTSKTVNLNDGSEIILGPGAILTQTSDRAVALKGNAYFDIAKDDKTAFQVETQHGIVTVIGTEFNIHTSSYKTQVCVTEGKVKIAFLEKEYFLEVNDMISLSEDMVQTSTHDIKREAWTTKVMTFKNNSLKHVLESVAIYYNVSLDWQTKEIEDNCKINTVFREESLHDIMKELSILSGLQYEIRNDKIIITSFKC